MELELGRRAHFQLHYKEIEPLKRWGNRDFLSGEGNDIQIEVRKTSEGAKLQVVNYIFKAFLVRSILYFIQEEEYKSLRYPHVTWSNTIAVQIKTTLVRLLKFCSLLFYKIMGVLLLKTNFAVQDYLICAMEDNNNTFKLKKYQDGCEEVDKLVKIAVFMVHVDKKSKKFVKKRWNRIKSSYHINSDLVHDAENEIKNLNLNLLTDYPKDFELFKRLIINYCRLRIGLHSNQTRRDEAQEVENYLKGLGEIEYCRLLARTLEDALSHGRYCETIMSVINPEDNRRVQISIDKKYLDLVSVYHTRKNGIGKNVNYYRVKSFDELKNVLEKENLKPLKEKPRAIADGAKVTNYSYTKDEGNYTNFNYHESDEKVVAQDDKRLIEDSGIMDLRPHELKTRCFYKKKGKISEKDVFVSIGFGNKISRNGHEDALELEKKIGKNVKVYAGEMHTTRLFLPLFFWGITISFIVLVSLNITVQGSKGSSGIFIDNFDRIGIVFAVWTLLGWIFVNFTETEGKLKDLILWRATFKKVSQVRKHFKMSRRSACRSFYCSEFLGSLVGDGYDCYFDPKKTKGPLEMDEMAKFDEVIGRKSIVRKDELLLHDDECLRLISMPTTDGMAHLKKENGKFEEKDQGVSLRMIAMPNPKGTSQFETEAGVFEENPASTAAERDQNNVQDFKIAYEKISKMLGSEGDIESGEVRTKVWFDETLHGKGEVFRTAFLIGERK